jgi:4-diphosphocytidyl-2-C-methyl-D-erythritol kinase
LKLQHPLPELGIYLHKTIPVGGGLGGGSADGVFTLLALNELLGLKLSRESLLDHAGSLGSDCPFFVFSRPSLVEGRGEKLEAVPSVLQGYFLMLAVPGKRVDTRYAYSMVKPHDKGEEVREIIQSPPGQWQGRLTNDFEVPLFSEYPELRAIKDRLYGSGAVYASMTGSGSGVYGIFESMPDIPADFSRYFVHREELM